MGTAFLLNHKGLTQYKGLPFIWGELQFAPPCSAEPVLLKAEEQCTWENQ